MNVATLPLPGNLGQTFDVTIPPRITPTGPEPESGADKGYRIVRLDSALASSATRYQATYWKDRARYIVTTNPLNAIAGINSPAGVVKSPIVAAGNYTCIQFEGPSRVNARPADVALWANGDAAIGSAASQGAVQRVASGTAPTNSIFGFVTGAVDATANTILVNLQVPETP
jgi:hypothetical protein